LAFLLVIDGLPVFSFISRRAFPAIAAPFLATFIFSVSPLGNSFLDYLKKAMKIRAMLCDEDETPEEVLSGLEESALLGYWKASW